MRVEARSFDLPTELVEELKTVADRRRRSIDEVLETAVRRFLEDESALLAKIDAARVDAAAGATVPWDDAERGFRETIARVAARRASA